ncbi:hypothetical protein T484DRAFT_2624877 [Baffinella frigidus]|nr:hypothetical protein T484DRAFT_2624877 [Cryptophyta sp. CCMP2293]
MSRALCWSWGWAVFYERGTPVGRMSLLATKGIKGALTPKPLARCPQPRRTTARHKDDVRPGRSPSDGSPFAGTVRAVSNCGARGGAERACPAEGGDAPQAPTPRARAHARWLCFPRERTCSGFASAGDAPAAPPLLSVAAGAEATLLESLSDSLKEVSLTPLPLSERSWGGAWIRRGRRLAEGLRSGAIVWELGFTGGEQVSARAVGLYLLIVDVTV